MHVAIERFNAYDMALWTKGYWHFGQPKSISGFHYDSRSLGKDQVFVALKTDKNDGHLFLKNVLEKEASAAIVEKIMTDVCLPQLVVKDSLKAFQKIAKEYRLLLDSPLIAITGSCGKTSTKDILTLLLGQQTTLKTQANLNNTLGVPFTILSIRKDHLYAVVEAGINRVGEMDVLADMLAPDVAIVTNIFSQHLEGLGSLSGIANQKSKLMHALKAKGLCVCGATCLDFNDFLPNNQDTKRMIVVAQLGTQKINNKDILFEYDSLFSKDLKTIQVKFKQHTSFSWTIPGMPNGMLNNAMMAIAVALELGVSENDIQERILCWRPSKHRGQWYIKNNQSYYLDCYNSGPAALRDSLHYFELTAKHGDRRLYVIAPMEELGNASEELHYQAAQYMNPGVSDTVLLINDKTQPIKQGLIAKNFPTASIMQFPDTASALAYVHAFSGSIFLKGSSIYGLHSLIPLY